MMQSSLLETSKFTGLVVASLCFSAQKRMNTMGRAQRSSHNPARRNQRQKRGDGPEAACPQADSG